MTNSPTLTLRDAVRAQLERAAADGAEVPSLRALRAAVGYGSLTTISEAVKEWRLEQAKRELSLPAGFPAESGEAVLAAVWKVVKPLMQVQIEAVQKDAESRIALERSDAAELKKASEEVLLESSERDKRLSDALAQVSHLLQENAQLSGKLVEAREQIDRLRAEIDGLRKTLDKATSSEVAAKAELDALKKLLPFLNLERLKAGA